MSNSEIEIDFSTGTILLLREKGKESVKAALGTEPSFRLNNVSTAVAA